MGEHKQRVVRVPNGDEPVKLSTHIVVVVDLPVPKDATEDHHAMAIEAAYDALARRAQAEESFILNVIQTVNVYASVSQVEGAAVMESRMLVTITAQRISRAELEQQQIRQRMGFK